MSQEKIVFYPPLATHSAPYGSMYKQDETRRIYTATQSKLALDIVLTLSLHSWGGASTDAVVEVLVNGASIADGVIKEIGYSSRTFLLTDVITIDLYSKTGQVHYEYNISVPLKHHKE